MRCDTPCSGAPSDTAAAASARWLAGRPGCTTGREQFRYGPGVTQGRSRPAAWSAPKLLLTGESCGDCRHGLARRRNFRRQGLFGVSPCCGMLRRGDGARGETVAPASHQSHCPLSRSSSPFVQPALRSAPIERSPVLFRVRDSWVGPCHHDRVARAPGPGPASTLPVAGIEREPELDSRL
jgi:hypothetical protein